MFGVLVCVVYNLKGFRFESIEGVLGRVGWALALEMSMFNLRLVKRGLSGVRFSLAGFAAQLFDVVCRASGYLGFFGLRRVMLLKLWWVGRLRIFELTTFGVLGKCCFRVASTSDFSQCGHCWLPSFWTFMVEASRGWFWVRGFKLLSLKGRGLISFRNSRV